MLSSVNSNILRASLLFNPQANINRILLESSKILQVRTYAARKGTRERKKKAKVKVEIQKVGFIPHNQRKKASLLLNRPILKFDDSGKRDPIDNVFVMKYYKWIVYPFADAVESHRETHHPDIYNKPNANLHVAIELNMIGEKKTRYVDNFSKICSVPHKFNHGEERSVIAFSKSEEDHKIASDAGAQLAGGVDLIKKIQVGEVSLQDFPFVVAHPNILPELVPLRGLMRRRFPNPKSGTLDVNLAALVHRFLHGVNYKAVKDEHEKDFGLLDAVIGTLDMDAKHLEENFAALVNDVYLMRPKREGSFITRCLLWSPPSQEKLKIEHTLYLPEETGTKINVEVEEEDTEQEKLERVAL